MDFGKVVAHFMLKKEYGVTFFLMAVSDVR